MIVTDKTDIIFAVFTRHNKKDLCFVVVKVRGFSDVRGGASLVTQSGGAISSLSHLLLVTAC